MSPLKITLLVLSVLTLFAIAFFVKKNKIAVKYSVMWILLPIVCILMVLFDTPLYVFSQWLGFQTLSNFVFFAVLGVVILFCFALTIIVSKQKKQITKMIQEIAILREQNEKK